MKQHTPALSLGTVIGVLTTLLLFWGVLIAPLKEDIREIKTCVETMRQDFKKHQIEDVKCHTQFESRLRVLEGGE